MRHFGTEEMAEGWYGGEELSLINFSDLEPDEILEQKYTKGKKKWLLVSFKSKQNKSTFRGSVILKSCMYVIWNINI